MRGVIKVDIRLVWKIRVLSLRKFGGGLNDVVGGLTRETKVGPNKYQTNSVSSVLL